MEFIHSNLQPMVVQKCKTFYDKFNELAGLSSELDIAVGYITADSLVNIQEIMQRNDRIKTLNLIIGMHYWEKFTRPEYMAALALNDSLQSSNRGEVRVVKAFKYHGKLYSYCNDGGPFAGIIGSNNLSSIVKGHSVYESSLLVDDLKTAKEMNQFIKDLSQKAAKNITDIEIDTFREVNPVLEGVNRVERSGIGDNYAPEVEYSFSIPIKTSEVAPGSNVNAFFGKGRKNKQGLVLPRPWYEVEMIVSKKITSQKGYPGTGDIPTEFKVFTDDGWSFVCNVNGDYKKNFRSKYDLEILGKWLKGRLEAFGALKPGERVTRETLKKYGRDNFTLAKIKDCDKWYLDFGVK